MSRVILIAFLLIAPAAAQKNESLSSDRPKGVPTAAQFGDILWEGEFHIPGNTKSQDFTFDVPASDQPDLPSYYNRLVRGAMNNLGLCAPDADCPALLQARLFEQTGSPDFILQYRVDTRAAKSEMLERFTGAREFLYIRVKDAWKDVGAVEDMKTAADRLTVKALGRAAYGMVKRDTYRIKK